MVLRTALLAAFVAGALPAGAALAQARDGVVTNASITVMDPAQVSHDSDLAVADVARPAKGSKTAVAAQGAYTLGGLGGEGFAISTPGTVVLTRSGGTEEIRLTLQPSQTVGAFAGPAGQPTTQRIELKGTLPVAADAKTGVYRGQYDVTIAFQ